MEKWKQIAETPEIGPAKYLINEETQEIEKPAEADTIVNYLTNEKITELETSLQAEKLIKIELETKLEAQTREISVLQAVKEEAENPPVIMEYNIEAPYKEKQEEKRQRI